MDIYIVRLSTLWREWLCMWNPSGRKYLYKFVVRQGFHLPLFKRPCSLCLWSSRMKCRRSGQPGFWGCMGVLYMGSCMHMAYADVMLYADIITLTKCLYRNAGWLIVYVAVCMLVCCNEIYIKSWFCLCWRIALNKFVPGFIMLQVGYCPEPML